MRVLAVDTTTAHGSVALLEDGDCRALLGVASTLPQHAGRLLPDIDELLKRAGRSLADLDGFAVARGPGAFTGLRIGIATVEGLSFATGRPVAGVSSLEATAFRFRHLDGWIVSMLEAHRGEVYGAVYRAEKGNLALHAEPVCRTPQGFLDSLDVDPDLFAGTGLVRCGELVASRFPRSRTADRSFFLAEEVGRLGAAKLAAGEGASLGSLHALYIRPSDAERSRRTG
jgi:tRNA threonylcarbamoyladenosine biosynthesis protein TsaB